MRNPVIAGAAVGAGVWYLSGNITYGVVGAAAAYYLGQQSQSQNDAKLPMPAPPHELPTNNVIHPLPHFTGFHPMFR